MSDGAATWLFDLGNTRVKGAALQARVLSQPISIAWQAHDFDAALRARLRPWPAPGKVLIASVASAARADRLRAALDDWAVPQQWLKSPRQGCGVVNRYREPARLGIDRFLAMAAAREASGNGAAVVVGCGTAMTLDAIDANGAQLEGLIAPSPELMLASLRGATAIGESNSSAFAVDDADDSARALRQGCLRAATALVQWHYARCRSQLGDPILWLHGGGATTVLGALEEPAAGRARLLDNAVLRGLQLWAEHVDMIVD